ncbi:cilia- and flagella-associated protein HOATZ isoform X2 [Lagopus muta]|uniref:cilia- and flagella-associated protein HOATZ isoform X2 n=1 Tax=Lagopus muta TaxID=64668 RepID=UPI00209F4D76|nr:cilia- and flagella-associated protein HOATZ isoform X2 [Lagopus muta]
MFLSSVRTAGPGTQAVGRDWRHQMERGHQSTAPHWPTEPDEPLVFAGSSPADVEFARIFWSTAVLPPLFEPCLCPTNVSREGPPSPGQIPAHRWTPSAAHGVQEAEIKDKHRQQAKKKEEILALLRKQREERIAVRPVPLVLVRFLWSWSGSFGPALVPLVLVQFLWSCSGSFGPCSSCALRKS